MKIYKLFLSFLIIGALASCNTPNRPKIIETVHGTPTNADTVLWRKQMKPLTKKQETPRVFLR